MRVVPSNRKLVLLNCKQVNKRNFKGFFLLKKSTKVFVKSSVYCNYLDSCQLKRQNYGSSAKQSNVIWSKTEKLSNFEQNKAVPVKIRLFLTKRRGVIHTSVCF